MFVASPSDVSDERVLLDGIVTEVNRLHARRTGVRLELFKWETDVSPGFGNGPQAVINDQIPPDYDVFIGIFWLAIGTPTGTAESGTIEEFQNAKARHDNDPTSVELMLYFKTESPLSLSDIDPDTLKKVLEFKASVSNQGLYREFASIEDFAQKLRVDLTKLVLDWEEPGKAESGEKDLSQQRNVVADAVGDSDSSDELEDSLWDDDGVLDLEEAFEDEMATLKTVLGDMTEAVFDIGKSMNRRAQQLEHLQGAGDDKIPSFREIRRRRTEAKKVLKNASGDMDTFVGRMNRQLPLYRQHLDKGLNAFVNAVPIYLEIYNKEDVSELKENIVPTLNSMNGLVTSMESFHKSVFELPKITTDLVRSKRATEKVLQEVIGHHA